MLLCKPISLFLLLLLIGLTSFLVIQVPQLVRAQFPWGNPWANGPNNYGNPIPSPYGNPFMNGPGGFSAGHRPRAPPASPARQCRAQGICEEINHGTIAPTTIKLTTAPPRPQPPTAPLTVAAAAAATPAMTTTTMTTAKPVAISSPATPAPPINATRPISTLPPPAAAAPAAATASSATTITTITTKPPARMPGGRRLRPFN